MTTSHLDRKELKRPDAFLERAGSLIHFVNENAKAVVMVLLALFGIGLGAAFYSNVRAHRSAEAESALFQARRSLESALGKTAPTPGADKTATPSADWEKNAAGALSQLEKVSKDFKGTVGSFEAMLLLGDVYSDHKNSEKARQYYSSAAAAAPSRSMKAVALHALAYSEEDLKQYDGAINALQQLLATGDKALKADSLMALARNYALKGDTVKANEQYDQVVKEFPNSNMARAAELQKSRLH